MSEVNTIPLILLILYKYSMHITLYYCNYETQIHIYLCHNTTSQSFLRLLIQQKLACFQRFYIAMLNTHETQLSITSSYFSNSSIIFFILMHPSPNIFFDGIIPIVIYIPEPNLFGLSIDTLDLWASRISIS